MTWARPVPDGVLDLVVERCCTVFIQVFRGGTRFLASEPAGAAILQVEGREELNLGVDTFNWMAKRMFVTPRLTRS